MGLGGCPRYLHGLMVSYQLLWFGVENIAS